MRARYAAVVVALVSLTGLLPASPASAVGATNVEFSISGTLPTFPCPAGCSTGFSGSGTGAGRASAMVGGTVYDATFTMLSAYVGGYASYTEPGVPFCPALGSATNPTDGTVTLNGNSAWGTTGVVYRTSTPTLVGTVTNVTVNFTYTYLRVGATPAIVITGGWVDISYFFPGTGSGMFTSSILTGAGSGVFLVDPVQAASRCLAPGPLAFTIIGDAAIATV